MCGRQTEVGTRFVKKIIYHQKTVDQPGKAH